MIDAVRKLPPAPCLSPTVRPSATGRASFRRLDAFPRAASQPAAIGRETDAAQPGTLRRFLVDVDRQRQGLDRAIRQAVSGRSFSPAELLRLQARVFAYGENLEIVSHLVDRAVSAVKTTLNIQV